MRKSIIKGSILAVTAATFLTGCMGGAAAPATPAAPAPVAGCTVEGEPAKEWVCMPMMDGAIVAVGSANKNAGNDMGFQRSEAMAEGRDALATQISTKVSTLFKSYKAATGSGADATFDKATSKVSKQLASQTLEGSKQYDYWQSSKGTMYLLVGISTDAVKNAMEEAVKTSYKNDKALYQEFKAAKAQGELDQELEKAAQ